MTTKIAIVEDDVLIAHEISLTLTKLGYTTSFQSTSGEEALLNIGEIPTDLILMDIRLAGRMNGIEAAKQIQKSCGLPVVFLTAHSDKATLNAAMDSAPFGYVLKPFEERDLSTAIEIAMCRFAAEQQIQGMNERLDYFCSSVCHDLRSPLTGILAISSALASRHAELLPPNILQMVKRIESSAFRMKSMLTTHLAFAREVEYKIEMSVTSVQQIVDQVLVESSSEIKERNIVVEVGELPLAMVNPELLLIVFQNLIGNAIKYTSRTENPYIEIGSDQTDAHLHFWVKDNGIGFEMAEVPKLFEPLQRLSSAKGFPGEGIGLANVRSIVMRHGGKISGEGSLNHGSKITFSLPRAVRDPVQQLRDLATA